MWFSREGKTFLVSFSVLAIILVKYDRKEAESEGFPLIWMEWNGETEGKKITNAHKHRMASEWGIVLLEDKTLVTEVREKKSQGLRIKEIEFSALHYCWFPVDSELWVEAFAALKVGGKEWCVIQLLCKILELKLCWNTDWIFKNKVFQPCLENIGCKPDIMKAFQAQHFLLCYLDISRTNIKKLWMFWSYPSAFSSLFCIQHNCNVCCE